MDMIKGAGLVFMKHLFKTKTPETEPDFIEHLNPEEKAIYKGTATVSWVALDKAAAIYAKSLPYLYPNAPKPMQAFCSDQAKYDLSGIYRVILMFLTVPSLIDKTAKLWKIYHSEGSAYCTVSSAEKNHLTLIVENYPNYLEVFNDINSGYCSGAMELCGAKNIKINHVAAGPAVHHWVIQWED